MAKTTHLLNGQDFGEPRNWRDLEIEIDWLNKKESGTINVSDLAFVGEANKYLQKRIMNGLSGGEGIFEGDPYQIKIGDPSSPSFVFEGFLDFTSSTVLIGGEEITCGLKKKNGEDWLNDVADGFSMAYLYDQNIIVNGDFVKVPYVINFVPDGMQLMILSMSIYMMTKELIENVEKLSNSIAEIVNASTPGVVVVVTTGGVGTGTAWDLGDWIMVVLKALARLVYLIAVTIAIVKLIEQLFEQLLPKKRNHLGMTFRRMMERSCEHLNLTFQSSIVELDWVHIPRKDRKGGSFGERGFPTNSEPIYTFGDLIRTLKEMFNADYIITNGVFRFERKDNFIIPSSYQMPSFFNNQERILDNVRFNTDEMVSNYNIHYQYDVQDQNTLDDVNGFYFQAVTSPNIVTNQSFVMIKNIAEISLPFSIGREKTGLTDVENILKSLAQLVDNITGIFGGGTNFTSKIDGRVGSLLLSSHFLTYGKIVKMSGSKLSSNQRSVLGAKNLWDKFHFINSFAEYQGQHNQFWRYEGQRVPMTVEEFATLLDNNFAVDQNGQEYIIEKVVYSPEKTTAVIDYRVKKKYTNNLKIEFL